MQFRKGGCMLIGTAAFASLNDLANYNQYYDGIKNQNTFEDNYGFNKNSSESNDEKIVQKKSEERLQREKKEDNNVAILAAEISGLGNSLNAYV